jgi:cation diffusion facilitator family transporter
MIVEAVVRLVSPTAVAFREALPVAAVGLVVNLISLKLLHHGEAAEELLAGAAPHEHHHVHDHNHRAAYAHIVADAVTSVFAIAALVAGDQLGWTFLDPLTGAAGGALILRWGIGLCRAAGRQLVDATASPGLEREVREALETGPDVRVADVHTWVTGPGQDSAVISVIASRPLAPSVYKRVITARVAIEHLHVEVHPCEHSMPTASKELERHEVGSSTAADRPALAFPSC